MLSSDHSAVVSADPPDFEDPEVEMQSVEEPEDEIAELCAHIDAATYRLLRAIGELDRRESWATGFESTAHWLNWRVGIDLVTARQKVRVARALENLPLISDAFRQGKVSYSKVRAMTRIATPQNEEYLLYIAENGTACHMESLVGECSWGIMFGVGPSHVIEIAMPTSISVAWFPRNPLSSPWSPKSGKNRVPPSRR